MNLKYLINLDKKSSKSPHIVLKKEYFALNNALNTSF